MQHHRAPLLSPPIAAKAGRWHTELVKLCIYCINFVLAEELLYAGTVRAVTLAVDHDRVLCILCVDLVRQAGGRSDMPQPRACN